MSVEETLARLVAFDTVSDRPVDGILAFLAERCEGVRRDTLSNESLRSCA